MQDHSKIIDIFSQRFVSDNSIGECVLLIDGRRFAKNKYRFIFKNNNDAIKTLEYAFRAYMLRSRLYDKHSFNKCFNELVSSRVVIVPAHLYYNFKHLLYKEPSDE